MLWRRKIILALAMLLVAGPIGATIGYGAYLRSAAYRTRTEAFLTDFFDLETTIERVAPLSLIDRRFDDVVIWLPERRDRVFACRRAIWRQGSDHDASSFDLTIRDGAMNLGSEGWRSSDYRQLLYSGLSHDFASLRLAQVRLANIDITLSRPELQLVIPGAAGTVLFPRPDEGRAVLTAHALNDWTFERAIQITARFDPLNGLVLHHVSLDLPWIAAAALGLEQALAAENPQGQFRGQVTYQELDDGWTVELIGEAREIQLAEFTGGLPSGPIAGRMDVSIDDLRIHNGLPTRLQVRGYLREVAIEPLAALLGGPPIEGTGYLTIESARFENRRIRQLSLRGQVDGPSLETITARLGQGVVTGRLSLSVNSLHVVDNEIRAADIDVTAVPPTDGTGTIERRLILGAIRSIMGVDLGRVAALLPETVPYVQFGVKLLVDDGTLRFLGTHGSESETILTVRVLGRDWGVLNQPSISIELKPLLDQLEKRAADLDMDALRLWWEERREQTNADATSNR